MTPPQLLLSCNKCSEPLTVLIYHTYTTCLYCGTYLKIEQSKYDISTVIIEKKDIVTQHNITMPSLVELRKNLIEHQIKWAETTSKYKQYKDIEEVKQLPSQKKGRQVFMIGIFSTIILYLTISNLYGALLCLPISILGLNEWYAAISFYNLEVEYLIHLEFLEDTITYLQSHQQED